jgi:ubiquinone/menaquinone biosynthesis C-methylase UbiE
MADPKRDFDAAAATWDENPHRVKMTREIGEALCAAVTLTPEMDALEIGCGTGLMTMLLQPQVRSILAVDTSEGMLNALRAKIESAQVTNIEPLKLDLTVADPPRPVDLVYSVMTFHHIPDPAAAVARLRPWLRPGAYVAVADLDAEDGSFHGGREGVEHKGFSAAQMKEILASGGLTDLRSTVAHTVVRPRPDGVMSQYPVLLTVGRMPS